MLSGYLREVIEEEPSVGKVEEVAVCVEDYILASQDIVVEEGVLTVSGGQLLGGCVVIVAEVLASFLLLLNKQTQRLIVFNTTSDCLLRRRPLHPSPSVEPNVIFLCCINFCG